MTRDEARKEFTGLSYDVLTPENVRRLRTRINQELVKEKLFSDTFRCKQRPKWFPGGVTIEGKARHFTDREIITFNPGGFVGFAGWASDSTVQPILRGFVEWVDRVKDTPNAGEWWCVSDYFDDGQSFAVIQTGIVKGKTFIWILNHHNPRPLWEKYNEIQFGKCPFGSSDD